MKTRTLETVETEELGVKLASAVMTAYLFRNASRNPHVVTLERDRQSDYFIGVVELDAEEI